MDVLITSDHYPDSKTSLNIWNPYTGTKVLSLRGPPAGPSSLTPIRDEGFAIVEEGKPFIHLWQVGSPLQTSKRILCPGKPGPMTMTPDGSFLVVAIDEKINIWQPATGRIVTVINSAHYRPVTALKFTDDGTFLISAAQDSMVLAWNFLRLVSGASTSPTYSWHDHNGLVTGIHVGTGGRKATVFTVGQDRFLKVYSLMTGTLLLNVAYPVPLSSVVADPAEMNLYIGAVNGAIYQMNISTPPRSLEHHVSTDAAADHIFKRHLQRITGLSISTDGNHLASSDEGGVVLLWDLINKDLLRTIMGGEGSAALKGKVTNIAFWLGNPESLKGGKKPLIAFPDVPKLIESNEDERQEREHVVTVWNRYEQVSNSYLHQQHQGNNNGIYNNVSNQLSGSMAEINSLKVKLAKCEEINRRLHEYCVDNIMGEGPMTKKAKYN